LTAAKKTAEKQSGPAICKAAFLLAQKTWEKLSRVFRQLFFKKAVFLFFCGFFYGKGTMEKAARQDRAIKEPDFHHDLA
jgi:hypothetical protein